MAIPKSKALISSESTGRGEQTTTTVAKLVSAVDKSVVKIRPVECLNDFVAILQSELETFLAIAGGSQEKFKNEGVVVGVGPGIADGAGGRLRPSVVVGDYVMFGDKNVVAKIEPDTGPYAGKKVVIVSERNILCKLPNKVEFELYN